MRQKPSEVLDALWADQEAYIAALEAENAALQQEVYGLRVAAVRTSGERLAEVALLALGGNLTPGVAGAMVAARGEYT
jgi:hypothetical protein